MAVRQQAVPSAQARAVGTTPGRRTNWGAIGRYIAVAVVLFIALAPFYWPAITSIKVDSDINASPPTLVPQSFKLHNYSHPFLTIHPAFSKDLWNITTLAIITTILAL